MPMNDQSHRKFLNIRIKQKRGGTSFILTPEDEKLVKLRQFSRFELKVIEKQIYNILLQQNWSNLKGLMTLSFALKKKREN